MININNIDNQLWNINHALYSPSGKRFIFLVRIYDNRNRRISNLIYKDQNGKIKFAFAGLFLIIVSLEKLNYLFGVNQMILI